MPAVNDNPERCVRDMLPCRDGRAWSDYFINGHTRNLAAADGPFNLVFAFSRGQSVHAGRPPHHHRVVGVFITIGHCHYAPIAYINSDKFRSQK